MLKRYKDLYSIFKASKDKAKDRRKSSSNDQNQEDIYRGDDAGDKDVISDHARGDDNDDMNDASSDLQGSNRSSFEVTSHFLTSQFPTSHFPTSHFPTVTLLYL